MRKEDFYKSLRRRNSGVFGTSLSQNQVDGCEAVLAECIRQGADLGQTAYLLARAYGETGGKMAPVEERLFYSSAKTVDRVFGPHRRGKYTAAQLARNPRRLANVVYGGSWGKKNLGNTQLGDGYRFRGRGMGQITGRRNYAFWSKNLGVDLLADPNLLIDNLSLSVRALVQPMLEGWATGKRLDQFVKGKKRDYAGAQATWNGNLDVHKYVSAAKSFEAALEAAGYAPQKTPHAPAQNEPAEQPSTGLAALLRAIAGLFSKRRTS